MAPLAPVCILAGGLGTRLGEQVRDTPKPLIEVAGRPFLEHQLTLLRRHDARRVVLCVGYLGERIEQRLGTSFAGIELRYRYDPPGLAGTAGAVRGALPDLDDRFLVLYGDTYLRIDYAAVEAASHGFPALMTVLRNEGRWDASNAEFDGRRVTRYEKGALGMDWIDYGLSVLTPQALGDEADLSQAFTRLANAGQLAGYEATERFYEIGTAAALAETDAFLSGTTAS